MSLMPRTLVFLALVFSMSLLSGVGPAPVEEMTSLEKRLMELFDGKVTAAPQKTKKLIDRSSLPKAAMEPMTREYLETFGPQKGKPFTRTIKKTRKYPKEWSGSSMGAVTDTIPGDFVFYEILDEKRGVVIQLELDIHSTVQVVYKPGQIMIPNSINLAPYDMKVLVYDLTNPTSVKHTGNLSVTTKDRGQWTVKTPAGEFDCVMFTIKYDGKVGPASVHDTALAFVSPEYGVIARVTRNKISAFLVYNADDRFAYTLIKKPER